MSAWQSTFGLIVVFGVLFPALVHGIVAVIAASVAGERRQNLEYEAERGSGAR